MKEMNDKLQTTRLSPSLNLLNMDDAFNSQNPFRIQKKKNIETIKHVFID